MPNTAIDDVIASFLDHVSERDFDEPFKALLRAHGFYDIHQVHGGQEMGKDFIAKRREGTAVEQWAFQSKAGNVAQGEWRNVRGQLDDLRTSDLSHPGFDVELPRRAVLVTTGRLTGGAPVSAQEYRQKIDELDELGFDHWDRETLIEMFGVHPEAALAGEDEGPFLRMLGEIDAGDMADRGVEQYSRRWFAEPGIPPPSRAVLECAVIAAHLKEADRLDLACLVALGLVRAAWVFGHGEEPQNEDAVALAEAGKRLFVAFAEDLAERVDESAFDPSALVSGHVEVGALVTYPARCLRTAELLALLALAADGEEREEVTGKVAKLVSQHPGCGHPLSDRWAVSLIPPVALLAGTERAVAQGLLEEVIRWIGNHYEERRLGLGPADAQPRAEIDYLIDGGLEHIEVTDRRESLVAAITLDLATAAGWDETYDLARNDFLAVNAFPTVIEVSDNPDQYRSDGSFSQEINPPYAESWAERTPEDLTAPHQEQAETPYLLRLGRPWDLLAIQMLIRTRYSYKLIAELIGGAR